MSESPAPPTPRELVAGLVRLLTVGPRGEMAFEGRPQPGGKGRMFGGQVIAQALQAAQATAPDAMQAHSLHAYFLRGGEEGPPVDYAVAADFTGRSFANRRVLASQNGTPILNLAASFQRAEDGLEHEDAAMPDVPPPDELRPDMEVRREMVAQAPGLSGRREGDDPAPAPDRDAHRGPAALVEPRTCRASRA